MLRTPDLDESSRLLIPNGHGKKFYGHKKNRVCRFCGKREPEVRFSKIAHALPESIGNHVLVTYYECDVCNEFFGNRLENEFNKFFSFYHSLLQLKGKSGIVRCNYKFPCELRNEMCLEYCIRIGRDDKGFPCISHCKNATDYISMGNRGVLLKKPVGRVIPVAIYKTFVKMALTVMPEEELPIFKGTIDWIIEKEHRNFYSDKRLLVRYRMIPGFNVTKASHFVLYRRKRDVWNMPYILFQLTYGCYSFLIEVPRDSYDIPDVFFERMPLPEISFYTDDEGIWDFSSAETNNELENQIYLNFEKATDVTEVQ